MSRGAKSGSFEARLWATVSALAFTCVASPAHAQAQQGTATQPPAAEPQEADEIVVTGIRASLERAAEIKRNSSEIVDVISAEDIGKLPDQNIAEGLQRITGVQIQRSGGEGNRFQIRGSNQNLTLINGNEVAPDADSGGTPVAVRSVNLFNYPSELFSEIRVYKSPSASLIEGGIGGTVDLRMPDPLKTKERILLVGEVGHLSLSKKVGYRGTALLSRRLMDDTLGIVLGVTHYKRDTVRDTYNGNSFFSTNAVDVNADGVNDQRVMLPFNMTYQRVFEDRTRTSVNGLLSWAPSDRFSAYLEGTYIHQKIDFARAVTAFNLSAARTTTPATALDTVTEADGSITIRSGRLRAVAITNDGLAQAENRNLYQGSLGARWEITKDLELSGEFGASKSKVDLLATNDSIFQPSVIADFNFQTEVPSASIVGGNIADPSAFQSSVIVFRDIANRPKLYQGRVDLAYKPDNSFVTKLAFGGRATRQTFDNNVLQNRFANTFPVGGLNPPVTLFPQFLAIADIRNFFNGADGNYPRRFTYAPIPATRQGGAALFAAYGDTSPLAPQPISQFEITERTRAAYVQLDFGGQVLSMPLSGNLGVRYVETRLRADGFAVPAAGAARPVTFENNYNDWLPSLNLKLEIAADFVARASASKALSRPPIVSLSPGTTVALANLNNTGTSGQPALDPFRADQFDIGLEYYFDDGGLVSAVFFYKDIKSYVVSTVTTGVTLPAYPGLTFTITQPGNGPGGVNKGIELGLQRSFGFIADSLRPFGIIANYTYVDSKRDGSPLPIENTSKHSFNVIGYFEQGPFQARVAYNWRDKQYAGLSRNSDNFIEARGQLDASMSFEISKNITFTLEGIDLLVSPQKGFSTYPGRPNVYEVNDRRIFGGVRVSF